MMVLRNFSKTCLLLFLFFGTAVCGFTQAPRNFDQFTLNWSLRYFNTVASANGNYTYLVTLTDGSEIEVTSKIRVDTTNNKQYLLLVDRKLPKSDPNHSRKIYSNETQNISLVEKKNDVAIIAFANDSCWLFRQETGKITLYTDLPRGSIVAFRHDNDPIEPFLPEKLEPILKDDEKAFKKFERKNYVGAVREYNANHRR